MPDLRPGGLDANFQPFIISYRFKSFSTPPMGKGNINLKAALYFAKLNCQHELNRKARLLLKFNKYVFKLKNLGTQRYL